MSTQSEVATTKIPYLATEMTDISLQLVAIALCCNMGAPNVTDVFAIALCYTVRSSSCICVNLIIGERSKQIQTGFKLKIYIVFFI